MRWSQALIPTQRETPADAVAPSHILLLRAGMVRPLGSGAYTYLPLGLRVLHKAMRIVREEMDAAGAQELLMPALHPIEIWRESGRDRTMADVLMQVRLGGDRLAVLGPTHEEAVTDIVRDTIKSYRQLPVTLYQIQTKFRDEPRPRFGIVRTREFLMKDAYSFGADPGQLGSAYDAMYEAYCRIFDRCGIPYVAVEAESGAIGGDVSHEFMVPAATGEDVVLHCPACDYAANREKAAIGPPEPEPTGGAPAAPAGKEEGLIQKLGEGAARAASGMQARLMGRPEVAADAPPPKAVATPGRRTIEEVCDFLKVDESQTAKLLVVAADGRHVGILIRGDHEANDAKLRRALGASVVAAAEPEAIEKAAGAPLGFLGPVGAKLPLYIDRSVAAMSTVVVGGNEPDVHLTGVVPGRDFPLENVRDLRNAEAGDPCPRCGEPMEEKPGIEIGHVFKLGTKYSKAMGATFLDDKGQEHPLIMGCYGIGINRILAAAVEALHDDQGILWPLPLAPYQVLVVPLQVQNEAVVEVARGIADGLEAAGVEVLIDDREGRPGVKFKDADLIGIPLRVVVGERGLKEGTIEVKWRSDPEAHQVSVATAVEAIRAELDATGQALAATCTERRAARAVRKGH